MLRRSVGSAGFFRPKFSHAPPPAPLPRRRPASLVRRRRIQRPPTSHLSNRHAERTASELAHQRADHGISCVLRDICTTHAQNYAGQLMPLIGATLIQLLAVDGLYSDDVMQMKLGAAAAVSDATEPVVCALMDAVLACVRHESFGPYEGVCVRNLFLFCKRLT